jgi:hypothetical protein
MTLLPPIPLYRRLLRLHRQKLNPEERIFGDTYVKAEFRRHRSIENPLHIVGFLQQWQSYGEMIDKKSSGGAEEGGDGQAWIMKGREGVDAKGQEEWAMEGLLEKMNDQQIGQVWELYNAIQKRHAGGEAEDGEGGNIEVEGDVTHLDGKK